MSKDVESKNDYGFWVVASNDTGGGHYYGTVHPRTLSQILAWSPQWEPVACFVAIGDADKFAESFNRKIHYVRA